MVRVGPERKGCTVSLSKRQAARAAVALDAYILGASGHAYTFPTSDGGGVFVQSAEEAYEVLRDLTRGHDLKTEDLEVGYNDR